MRKVSAGSAPWDIMQISRALDNASASQLALQRALQWTLPWALTELAISREQGISHEGMSVASLKNVKAPPKMPSL